MVSKLTYGLNNASYSCLLIWYERTTPTTKWFCQCIYMYSVNTDTVIYSNLWGPMKFVSIIIWSNWINKSEVAAYVCQMISEMVSGKPGSNTFKRLLVSSRSPSNTVEFQRNTFLVIKLSSPVQWGDNAQIRRIIFHKMVSHSRNLDYRVLCYPDRVNMFDS